MEANLSTLKVAVVTENHPIDMFAFCGMLREFGNVDYYVQSIDLLAADEKNLPQYDAFLFYNLSIDPPENEQVSRFVNTYLGSTSQGIVLLHHAVCCYPGLQAWTEMTGIVDRSFKYHWDQSGVCRIASGEHPIVRGMEDFDLDDETYTMEEPSEEGTEVLITVDHPVSMSTIAWTRNYGRSRVLNYVSGHDDAAYFNLSFLQVLRRGLEWTANHRL